MSGHCKGYEEKKICVGALETLSISECKAKAMPASPTHSARVVKVALMVIARQADSYSIISAVVEGAVFSTSHVSLA